jgi:cutinase
MKFWVLTLSILVGIAATSLVLDKRQATANDVQQGDCKKVTLIFARASTEPGNMVNNSRWSEERFSLSP